ncbi:hypothetical protein F5X98DRAFT_353892, partial [Xylaria grammica]
MRPRFQSLRVGYQNRYCIVSKGPKSLLYTPFSVIRMTTDGTTSRANEDSLCWLVGIFFHFKIFILFFFLPPSFLSFFFGLWGPRPRFFPVLGWIPKVPSALRLQSSIGSYPAYEMGYWVPLALSCISYSRSLDLSSFGGRCNSFLALCKGQRSSATSSSTPSPFSRHETTKAERSMYGQDIVGPACLQVGCRDYATPIAWQTGYVIAVLTTMYI